MSKFLKDTHWLPALHLKSLQRAQNILKFIFLGSLKSRGKSGQFKDSSTEAAGKARPQSFQGQGLTCSHLKHVLLQKQIQQRANVYLKKKSLQWWVVNPEGGVSIKMPLLHKIMKIMQKKITFRINGESSRVISRQWYSLRFWRVNFLCKVQCNYFLKNNEVHVCTQVWSAVLNMIVCEFQLF